jgi:hypothetical protein
LLPHKCSALWSKKPQGTEAKWVKLGDAKIPILGELNILGQQTAFRPSSEHCFQHRLAQAWKAAYANAPLLRSTMISHQERLRLLHALIKPCLLYGCQSWKLTPALLVKILEAERDLSRWCLRLHPDPQTEHGDAGDTLDAWIQWRSASARKIAEVLHKNGSERWHQTALKLHWQWAGHAARMGSNSPNCIAATRHIRTTVRGRPPAGWAQLLCRFSEDELYAEERNFWAGMAQDRSIWDSFCVDFIDYVDNNILHERMTDTLRNDDIAVRAMSV